MGMVAQPSLRGGEKPVTPPPPATTGDPLLKPTHKAQSTTLVEKCSQQTLVLQAGKFVSMEIDYILRNKDLAAQNGFVTLH